MKVSRSSLCWVMVIPGHVDESSNVKLSENVDFAGGAAAAVDTTKASADTATVATAKNLRMTLPSADRLLLDGRREPLAGRRG